MLGAEFLFLWNSAVYFNSAELALPFEVKSISHHLYVCVFAPLLCANAKKGESARENRGATEHVVVPRGTCVKFISSLTNAFAANRSIMRTVTQSWWMGLYKFHPSLWGGPQILKNCRVGAEGWRRPRSPYFSSLLFLTFEETGCLPINQTASDTKSLLRNFCLLLFSCERNFSVSEKLGTNSLKWIALALLLMWILPFCNWLRVFLYGTTHALLLRNVFIYMEPLWQRNDTTQRKSMNLIVEINIINNDWD